MGCFGRRSKPAGKFDNPAYTFNNPPPPPPPPPAPAPIPSQNSFNASTFRPEGIIPDGKGALPSYPSSGPSSSSAHYPQHSVYALPPGPPPPAATHYPPQQPAPTFHPPPPAFLPSPADDLDLPPPPSISHEVSPASNTTPALADAGYEFCVRNPLAAPQFFTAATLSTISSGTFPLAQPPPCFKGTISTSPSHLPLITTSKEKHGGCPDTCLISVLPLYCAGYHHPANTGKPKTIFFEISIDALPSDSTVAIGFAACPYPGFRLPGWNRGSLGVHSDDGRRYCNDSYGGKDFTTPFRQGETVGIGMVFPAAGQGSIEVYFTRAGQKTGGWKLDEETDAELDWNATEGLDGSHDVYAAIGIWGGGIKVGVKKFVRD